MKNIFSFIILLCFFPLSLYVFLSQNAFSKIPSKYEVPYSKAVLNYKTGKLQEALSQLKTLLQKAPEKEEFLEFEALLLKKLGKKNQARVVFKKLVLKKLKEKRPVSERAPYHFELGTIYLDKKNTKRAKLHFRESLKGGFNVGACHFFLGLIAFQNSKWSEAQTHFKYSTDNVTENLSMLASFYLGQIYLKTGYSQGASEFFKKANTKAKNILHNPTSPSESKTIAKQILEATEKMLQPFSKGSFFGSLALLASYDSNVLAIPDTVTSQESTGKSTLKNMFQFGVGYSSSPRNTIQWVPSYRGSLTYHWNRESSEGEFASNILSLSINIHPLSQFSYGLQIEGQTTFENAGPTETTKRFDYELFSLTGAFNPYFHYAFLPHWELEGNLSFLPQYYQDDKTQTDTNFKRSGYELQSSLTFSYTRATRYFNPSWNLTFKTTRSKGNEYQAQEGSFAFYNSVFWKQNLRTIFTFLSGYALYPARPGHNRKDLYLEGKTNTYWALSPTWTVLGELSYEFHNSTISDQYEYNRFVISLGMSFSF